MPQAQAMTTMPATSQVPRQPRTFKVVLVANGAVLADGADARTTVELLAQIDSIFDVSIYVWHTPAGAWRHLTPAEHRTLWDFRGRCAASPITAVSPKHAGTR